MNMSRAGTPARPGNTRTPRLGLNRCVFTSTSRGPVMRTAPRGSRQVDEERDRPRAASFPRLTGRISETGHRLLLAARSRHLYSVISWKLKSASKPGTKRGEKERRRTRERATWPVRHRTRRRISDDDPNLAGNGPRAAGRPCKNVRGLAPALVSMSH